MDRRTLLSMLGVGAASLAALTAGAALLPAMANSGGDHGGDHGGGEGGGEGHEGGGEGHEGHEGEESKSNNDDPGAEAQPEAAEECAAGTDCVKK